MADEKLLYELLETELGKKNIKGVSVPDVITDNLNPLFEIRPYQLQALQYFISYWEEVFDGKVKINHHLLFHMATGSGKTIMMAALILYLYRKGFRNFLFFVNSANIINKTRDNFLNPLSAKYLFSDVISVSNEEIRIQEIDNFQAGNPDNINIKFITIQGLHTTLRDPKENSLTYDDFIENDVVFLSDEAHHINAGTKNKKKLTQEEMFEKISWESTVSTIFQSNPKNVMLEFTATMDMSHEAISNKYASKLIYDYPLKRFREDGYSKDVKIIQADMPPMERALQVVILSQYRKKMFEKYRKSVKPVIMFKSKKIQESAQFFSDFVQHMANLSGNDLQALGDASNEENITKCFLFFQSNNINLDDLAEEIKDDFAEDKLIIVNSQADSELKQIAVNSLEKNQYRAVFAVDKLNEGWDVLNLFDIVRLYDTRDAAGKTTMQEAQLIGRGARYFPFGLEEDDPLYLRKYDDDLEHDLRIGEEMHYHCAHNPKYIQELGTCLVKTGTWADKTVERDLILKDEFKDTALYRAGHIYLNKRQKYNREDIHSLDGRIKDSVYRIKLLTGSAISSAIFDAAVGDQSVKTKSSGPIVLSDVGFPIIFKAISRNKFYQLSNLRNYLPNLKSIKEFIESDRYLAGIKFIFEGNADRIKNPTPSDYLLAVSTILDAAVPIFENDKVEYKGSIEFEPRMIKDVFTDKKLKFNIDLDAVNDKETGKSMNNPIETAYHLNLEEHEWYVFNDCYGTSEEKLLIKYIESMYEALSEKYSDVYLIRNERHFKLYSFNDGRAIEPDFLLYLVGKGEDIDMHYQIFIEPKGGQLLLNDQWKEDFLKSIKEHHHIEQLFNGKEYVVWGMPFYNKAEEAARFIPAFNEVVTD